MLTSGKQSQEEARIQSLLQKLSGITFVPEQWSEEILWSTIEEVGFTQEDILTNDEASFFQKFIDMKWSWDQVEHFGDILVGLEQNQPNQLLRQRAKHLYQFILDESKLYSFQIMTKMNKL